jgi:3-oxoacyl-(acyl-carrier-protein) reductase
MASLQGKVALVTGSSRGIGAAIADELGRNGASVAVNYVRNADMAEQVAARVREAGGKTLTVQADVRNRDEVERMVQTVTNDLGPIDILVNNAGINRDRTLRRMSTEEWQEVIDTNLTSMFHCTSLVMSGMIDRNEGGSIINISSIVGEMGNFGQANYAATKAGIIGFTKTLALELARYKITANVVAPGFILTEMVQGVPDQAKEQTLARIPLGRFGDPEEVARLVRFLAAEGTYITGQVFNINGGMYM